jgi:negative regulator of sigma E activity
VLESDGDATVTQKVIAPYFAEDEQIEDLPLSSVIITPKNYNFHFMGEATIANTLAAVFRIVPKKKRAGLIRGEL